MTNEHVGQGETSGNSTDHQIEIMSHLQHVVLQNIADSTPSLRDAIQSAINEDAQVEVLLAELEATHPGITNTFDGHYAAAIMAEAQHQQSERRQAQAILFRGKLDDIWHNLS